MRKGEQKKTSRPGEAGVKPPLFLEGFQGNFSIHGHRRSSSNPRYHTTTARTMPPITRQPSLFLLPLYHSRRRTVARSRHAPYPSPAVQLVHLNSVRRRASAIDRRVEVGRELGQESKLPRRNQREIFEGRKERAVTVTDNERCRGVRRNIRALGMPACMSPKTGSTSTTDEATDGINRQLSTKTQQR